MRDMGLVADIDVASLPEGSSLKIVTDADNGGWRGRLARLSAAPPDEDVPRVTTGGPSSVARH
jgi:hypothetical protein